MCRHRRVFWERRADTKAVVAWGRRVIVVAFRGTATVKNAKLDLQVRLLLAAASAAVGILWCACAHVRLLRCDGLLTRQCTLSSTSESLASSDSALYAWCNEKF